MLGTGSMVASGTGSAVSGVGGPWWSAGAGVVGVASESGAVRLMKVSAWAVGMAWVEARMASATTPGVVKT